MDCRRTNYKIGKTYFEAGDLEKTKKYLSSLISAYPKHKYAGKLIEEAGCKGMRVGDAQVSTKHANFIVNLGEAKASDVIKLMARVQKIVKDKHRVTLEPELKFMVECKK